MNVYQENYTNRPAARAAMYDREKRTMKARKILSVIEDGCGDLSRLALLDMSCSAGIMTNLFAAEFATVVGIDIDKKAVEHARQNQAAGNLHYHVKDALNTTFDTASFDVVVCNQMYEHVPSARQLMSEIHRLLKPGGICYFGATNRLKLIEPHYGKIPFLSIMPKPCADLTLRLLGRAERYYETHLTCWGLRRLVSRFELFDYTRKIVEDPVKYNATDLVRPESLRQMAALAVLRYAYWLFPGYIWLLKKPH
jgi:2-polyprenyl-3-methyl-5-hydroxy-6-metoxy-1,4-benzoquinol methylase